MKDIIDTFAAVLRIDRRGVTAVEYAIIAGAVALVIGLAFSLLGTNIGTEISAVAGAA